ncbi:O-antigen ligase domain-containing protein [Candidatus Microgenomates bacterium]|nr:MAG: O-antigen ligase domain-containing protein [Candidatus Microgenomates bacterium]
MKLTRKLFFLFLLLLPTQLGIHYWPSFALVLGRRIDYLSPTVYLSDILLLLTSATLVIATKKEKLFAILKMRWLLILLAFLTINVLFAQQFNLAFLGAVRLVEMGLVIILIKNLKLKLGDVLVPLSLSTLYVTLLAALQFFQQSSLQGIWYFLGERRFLASTPGISLITVSRGLLLRSYSTFSHPNVLAGFCTVVFFLLLIWQTQTKIEYVLKRISLLATGVGIFLSFSRSAWVVVIALGLFAYVRKTRVQLTSYLLIVSGFVVTAGLVWQRFTTLLTVDAISITERQKLMSEAFRLFAYSPIFGVGFLNFIPAIVAASAPPYIMQPVHSLYILVLSETGLLGFGLLASLLFTTLRQALSARRHLLLPIVAVLLLGMVDHYFLTQPQTRLLIAVVLGLLFI